MPIALEQSCQFLHKLRITPPVGRYHQERWEEAADQIAKSHTMTPELLYQLCDSYFHLGKTQDADLTAELVAAYGRNNPELMKELATLLKSNGQGEVAQRLGL